MAASFTMAQALNAALRDALKDDERVLVFGEDVGPLGGVFRITDGLTRDFGEQRCFDTPLAEAGIVGLAVGMAMGGFRPVVEMQFDAFAYPAFEQITSHVAKIRNRTRGAVSLPMVIRIPFAGGIGGVEHHCDSSEAYYAHTPGLTWSTPASVEDAYWLLREAIADPDPVIFLEPKRLYLAKEDVDSAPAHPAVRAGRRAPHGHGRDADRLWPLGAGGDGGGRGGGRGGLGSGSHRPAHARALRRRDRHRIREPDGPWSSPRPRASEESPPRSPRGSKNAASTCLSRPCGGSQDSTSLIRRRSSNTRHLPS